MSTLPGRLLRLHPYAVDLLRERRSPPPFAWILLLAGVLALAGAVLMAMPELERRAAQQRELDTLQAELVRLGSEAITGRSSGRKAATQRGAEQSESAEALLLQAEIHRPWHELFGQLASTLSAEGDGVHIVQLGIDARFETLQLVAEGRELDKLVRFAQHLSGKGPIRSMTMTHHEWRDTMGAHVVSASMIGQISREPGPESGVSP